MLAFRSSGQSKALRGWKATPSDQLRELPPLPYSDIKEFVIAIAPCYQALTACRLRANLLWLCGLLRHNKVHFQRLKIEFDNTLWCDWNDAWDEAESDYIPLPLVYDNVFDLPNAEFTAYKQGFSSVFSWLISPLALLPTAGECMIELPAAFKGKRHFVDLAKWYEKGIDGTHEFGDHPFLQRDIEQFEQMRKK
ncbi:MAG: hypothetical protein LQ343_004591 [Gyalolechia ehrenbergii]|nr:MAG: hypothetical protein LQ343_004591 [Gyalolechia ehrenbergii]